MKERDAMSAGSENTSPELSVSVAMCIHQSERYLLDQLESFARQRRLPDEVVISDDGAPDRTVQELLQFARRAPFPVRHHRNSRQLGSPKNFERAISLCSGDVVFLSDADDVWHPTKIEKLLTVLQRDPRAGAVFCNSDVVDERLRPLGYTVWDAYLFPPRQQRRVVRGAGLDVLLRHNVIGGNTLAFRSMFRDLITPIPPDWVHDQWIPLLISAVSRLRVVREQLLLYRQHRAQRTGARLTQRSLRGLVQEKRNTPADAYLQVAQRYEAALARLRSTSDGFPPVDGALPRLEAKIQHSRIRGRIWRGEPRFRLLALEALRFNYHRYSRGWRSIAVDAFLADVNRRSVSAL
jgi:glycosyltransferase involved in cell wall biosynthesis